MTRKAFISGCLGAELSADERAFFADERPWGFILFARNLLEPQQVRDLTSALRESVGDPASPVLIDQEGGRVKRLSPQHWPQYPPARHIGRVYERDPEAGLRAAWLAARLIAHDLLDLGITVDCLPVLDVPSPGSHDVIGDRAYSGSVDAVIALGTEAAQGLRDGGVAPVMKHMPGHGRAQCDSHHELPRASASLEDLKSHDFLPFKALSDMRMGMSAHIVVEALDAERPATISPVVVEEIVRGFIGFDGLLMSDDLSMNALSGDCGERARSVFEGGCDLVLHCNGKLDEMRLVAQNTPMLSGRSLERAGVALDDIGELGTSDIETLRAEFESLLAISAAA
ncbi:MAG: beta-N-acetylhexosaminidase [Pseudomonadota bacterium]